MGAEDGALWLRAWEPADAPVVAGLLDPDADPLWVAQCHALHGPPREGERWRRTLVAVRGDREGKVVGAATVARNWVHPGQYSCAIDVHRAWRRQGVGRRLLDGLREVRPETLPLVSKLRPSNAAAMGFLAAAGGGVRQRSPGQVVDVADHRVLAWAEWHGAAAEHSGPPGLRASASRCDLGE